DDHVIHFARFGGADGVEEHGARVAPGFLADDLGAGALAPDFQLLDGGGTESVGSAEQDGTLFILVTVGEFADGGCFARAVDADHEDDGGRFGDARHRAFAGLQDFEQVLANQVAEFGGVRQLVAFYTLANAFENFVGGADADVGGN